MKARPYEDKDLDALWEIYVRGGYGFTMPEKSEDFRDHYFTLADDNDAVLMGAGYRLMPEMTLLCAPGGTLHPLLKLQGIALLHEALRDTLTAKGYHEAIASVPPQIAASYGRHLRRHFGWQESWQTFRIRDWKEKP